MAHLIPLKEAEEADVQIVTIVTAPIVISMMAKTALITSILVTNISLSTHMMLMFKAIISTRMRVHLLEMYLMNLVTLHNVIFVVAFIIIC